uniref:Uncharacterized protein n=1 Tax=Periophthalmus magnuspinnatus TaxID=409849 RepID=A0A3B3ZTW3_9GOBI
MRLRNASFLTLLLFGLCALVSLSWYTTFSGSRGLIRSKPGLNQDKIMTKSGVTKTNPGPATMVSWV